MDKKLLEFYSFLFVSILESILCSDEETLKEFDGNNRKYDKIIYLGLFILRIIVNKELLRKILMPINPKNKSHSSRIKNNVKYSFLWEKVGTCDFISILKHSKIKINYVFNKFYKSKLHSFCYNPDLSEDEVQKDINRYLSLFKKKVDRTNDRIMINTIDKGINRIKNNANMCDVEMTISSHYFLIEYIMNWCPNADVSNYIIGYFSQLITHLFWIDEIYKKALEKKTREDILLYKLLRKYNITQLNINWSKSNFYINWSESIFWLLVNETTSEIYSSTEFNNKNEYVYHVLYSLFEEKFIDIFNTIFEPHIIEKYKLALFSNRKKIREESKKRKNKNKSWEILCDP